MKKVIHPAKSLRGEISVPGDKSISHRALMFSALAEGESKISNLSHGQDVKSTQSCLKQLGVKIHQSKGQVIVRGVGLKGFKQPQKPLDAGNSGTTMRLLSGLLAAQPIHIVLTGDESLRSRPMGRIITPLHQMGAKIKSQNGYAPLVLSGKKKLKAIHYHTPVASAQVKSSVLLAGLSVKGVTCVTEPAKSRDHTERMLRAFGMDVDEQDLTVSVRGPVKLLATDIDVPGDISSAAFFIAAALLVPNAALTIRNIGLNPTRNGILQVLRKMGAKIAESNPSEKNHEPRADLKVSTSPLKGFEISGHIVPNVIDEIPILAVLASQAEGKTVIRDAAELRVKETDRIHAVCKNLKAMGVEFEEFEDGFSISGPQPLFGATLDSFGDHRIAMAFAVAGLIASGKTTILNPDCAEISFPGFYDLLEKTIQR